MTIHVMGVKATANNVKLGFHNEYSITKGKVPNYGHIQVHFQNQKLKHQDNLLNMFEIINIVT